MQKNGPPVHILLYSFYILQLNQKYLQRHSEGFEEFILHLWHYTNELCSLVFIMYLHCFIGQYTSMLVICCYANTGYCTSELLLWFYHVFHHIPLFYTIVPRHYS